VEEDRTPDLRIANAALSQLSYHPMEVRILASFRSGDNARVAAGAGLRQGEDLFTLDRLIAAAANFGIALCKNAARPYCSG
jgi:hypothetical protein